MEEYKALYYLLFNAVTDAVDALQMGFCHRTLLILMQAQQQAEEIILQVDEDSCAGENEALRPERCHESPSR